MLMESVGVCDEKSIFTIVNKNVDGKQYIFSNNREGAAEGRRWKVKCKDIKRQIFAL